MEVKELLEWTFISEAKPCKHIEEILIEGEVIEACYKTVRDQAAITNKRFIIANKQGITGTKVEVYTIPFKSIIIYSTENSGKIIDMNAEIELWTRVGRMKLKVKRGVDIRKLDRIIATHLL